MARRETVEPCCLSGADVLLHRLAYLSNRFHTPESLLCPALGLSHPGQCLACGGEPTVDHEKFGRLHADCKTTAEEQRDSREKAEAE